MHFEELIKLLKLKVDTGYSTDVIMCIKLEGIDRGYSMRDELGIPWACIYDAIQRYKNQNEDFNCVFGTKNGKIFVFAFAEDHIETFSYFHDNTSELKYLGLV
jgi:hypothetical protein